MAHEQMALIDGAFVLRKGGAGNGEAVAEIGQQRLGDRADIAPFRAVEGGAVLEEEPGGAGLPQPGQCGARVRHGLRDGLGPRLQRNDDGIDALRRRAIGHADHLDGAHAFQDKRVRKVRGPGEIIGNAAEH